MYDNLTQFAAGDVFSALGIDWPMLIFQVIGFAILVWLMARFVYPPMLKTIDARKADIDSSAKIAKEAEEKAAKAGEEVARLLKEARDEATNIVTTAKDEANAMIEEAESKSQTQAERILAMAQEDIAREISAAKKALHNETVDLVAIATEKVIGKVVDEKVDNKLVAKAVEESL